MLVSKSLGSDTQSYIQAIRNLIPASLDYMEIFIYSQPKLIILSSLIDSATYTSIIKLHITFLILKMHCPFLKKNSDLLDFLLLGGGGPIKCSCGCF